MLRSVGRSLASREVWVGIAIVFLLLLPVLAVWHDQHYLVTQFRKYLIFAIAAVSLNLILGYGGMVSFGQAAFVGVGAYTVGMLNAFGLGAELSYALTNPIASWALAAFAGAIFAMVIGAVSLRTSGVYFIMITLAFAQLLYFIVIGLKDLGGEEGLRFRPERDVFGLFSLNNGIVFYYTVLGVLALVLCFSAAIVKSRFGYVLQGSRDNERRMRSLGFDVFYYKLVAFVISGAVAGLAGGMLATHEAFVSPAIMHWGRSGDLIIMVILGGIGTLFGPVVGAVLFLFLEGFLPDYSTHWMLPFGILLILIVYFARQGLYGLLRPLPSKMTIGAEHA